MMMGQTGRRAEAEGQPLSPASNRPWEHGHLQGSTRYSESRTITSRPALSVYLTQPTQSSAPPPTRHPPPPPPPPPPPTPTAGSRGGGRVGLFAPGWGGALDCVGCVR